MSARRSLLGRRLTGFGWCGRVVPAIAMGLIFAAAAMPAGAQDKKDSDANKSDGNTFGFIASKHASAKELSFPVYPGSRRHKDDSDDSASVQRGAWGGSSG